MHYIVFLTCHIDDSLTVASESYGSPSVEGHSGSRVIACFERFDQG